MINYLWQGGSSIYGLKDQLFGLEDQLFMVHVLSDQLCILITFWHNFTTFKFVSMVVPINKPQQSKNKISHVFNCCLDCIF